MKILTDISEMRAWSRQHHGEGSLGLVPTMGFLHDGHLSLVRESRARCQRTVVSLFVNPAQFGPNEDLDTYPANWERDRALLEAEGVDAVFLPNRESMYPEGYATFVAVEGLSDPLCGTSRPGFFRGVATIVMKLFHIVEPDVAYFGEKDRQQLHIIQRMVQDLNMDIEIVGMPIVREADGVAQSSRNSYLSDQERRSATCLHEALESARSLMLGGESSAEKLRLHMRETIESRNGTRIDYIAVCDPDNFKELETVNGRALLALAVQIGPARLIDNCLVEKN